MPKVCRDLDLGFTGHPCTAIIGAKAMQRTVFVNGKRMCKLGDPALPHTILKGKVCVGHPAQINAGSRTVLVGGIPVARVGDSFDKGAMVQGSSNVFAGGPSGGGGLGGVLGGIAGALGGDFNIIGGGIGGDLTATEGSF